MQHLSAIRLEDDVLHIECAGTDPHRPQKPFHTWPPGKCAPLRTEINLRNRLPCALAVQSFLLPQRIQVQPDHGNCRALHHLNQAQRTEIRQQPSIYSAAADQTQQQHRVHQRHHTRPRLGRGQVSRQCQTCGLGDLHPGAHEQKRQRSANPADPQHARLRLAQSQQAKRHDGQTTEQQQRAYP